MPGPVVAVLHHQLLLLSLPEYMESDSDPVKGGRVAAVVPTITQVDRGQGEGSHGLGHVVGEAALGVVRGVKGLKQDFF